MHFYWKRLFATLDLVYQETFCIFPSEFDSKINSEHLCINRYIKEVVKDYVLEKVAHTWSNVKSVPISEVVSIRSHKACDQHCLTPVVYFIWPFSLPCSLMCQ